MCGAMAVSKQGLDYFINAMKAEKAFNDEFRDRFNVRPQQEVPVIFKKDGKTIADFAFFGLLPSWSKERYLKFSTINARSEDIESKASFSKPFKTQRCILPTIGYYEWMPAGKEKIPFYHQLKGGQPFAMACIFDVNKIAGPEPILSFSILTTKPGPTLAKIHDRKPVILSEEEIKDWLNPETSDVNELKKLLTSIPEEEIEVFRVSQDVNSARNEGPELIQRFKN
jgi:putative SOS response-associated peptidase YedK